MTPKEAAIAVEALLRDAGYMLRNLTFMEYVGTREATYDFSNDIIVAHNLDGLVRLTSDPASSCAPIDDDV